ncbi:MAG: tetratricopeptide repeat protein [Bacteroidetes bacterium]|nr:tetratricopeptide repeat protein [Bacteroidota bacterium]
MNYRRTYSFFFFFTILTVTVLFTSCSTKKNTWTRRAYHNTTAHFNVYWNGMDNLRQGVKDFEANLKDNYTVILPVYNYGDKASASKISQYADIAIKKAQKCIPKHSMIFNKKEYNKWIDDCYLLMGKAYFYKQDYSMARRTFEFIIKSYNDREIKWGAMLWLAKSNMALNDFTRAEPMLDMIQNKIRIGQAPDKYEKELNLVYADFSVLQKNYPSAIDYLNRAIELKPGHTMKTRCLFISAQIHQANGEMAEATKLFETVIKRNASFEMEFNAKINLARCYLANSGKKDYIVKKLKKMLKEDKNKDQLDQVYYALSEISLKDGDTTSGIDYLSKSVATSKTNNYQKAISSLALADIYFPRKNYLFAQAYYDSTMQFLPKDYPNYTELTKRTSILTDLVKNLITVQREDSLQKLATMSEGDRNKVIDKIIAKVIEEDNKRMEEERARQEARLFGFDKDMTIGGGATSGAWYFYNPSTLSNGYTSFIKKWGRRTLEDNWFLGDKSMASIATEVSPDSTDNVETDTISAVKKKEVKKDDKRSRKFYLKDVPFKPEQLEASTNKIIEAYYTLGFIYIEGLHDYEGSISSFETLNTRYPKNKLYIASTYELYKLYGELENKERSDYYKNLILTKYAETDFAKLLVNPNYFKEAQSKQKEVEILYEDTYKAFSNQQYYMVINNCDLALKNYPKDSVLLAKFEFMKGMAIGKIEVVDSLVSAMQKVIKKYPKSQVRPLAQNVLDFLGTQRNSQGQPIVTDTVKVQDAGPKIYTENPGAIHFYILIVNNEKTDVEALKFKISDFNLKFHSLETLQVNSLLLDGNLEMITVNNFESKEKGMDYYISIMDNEYIFTKLKMTGDYYQFTISVDNYPIFYRSKNIQQYLRFFEKNYPVIK